MRRSTFRRAVSGGRFDRRVLAAAGAVLVFGAIAGVTQISRADTTSDHNSTKADIKINGLDVLANTCKDSKLQPHDGFQKGDRCVSTEFGEVASAANDASLLIVNAPKQVDVGQAFTLEVSTRNLIRDRFLGAAAGGYYVESSVLAGGIERGHFHTACRLLPNTKEAPPADPVPDFFVATEDKKGGRTADVVKVNVTGIKTAGDLQCSSWAGDGSHRIPMMERANQTPAIDSVRITVRAGNNGGQQAGNNGQNGGTQNGGTQNGGTQNGGTQNGGTQNGGTQNGGAQNGGNGQAGNGQQNNGGNNPNGQNGQQGNRNQNNGQNNNGQNNNGQNNNGQNSNAQPGNNGRPGNNGQQPRANQPTKAANTKSDVILNVPQKPVPTKATTKANTTRDDSTATTTKDSTQTTTKSTTSGGTETTNHSSTNTATGRQNTADDQTATDDGNGPQNQAAAVQAPVKAEDKGGLALTGSNTVKVAGAGVVILVLGLLIFTSTRRRRGGY